MSNIRFLAAFYKTVWIEGKVQAIRDFYSDEMQAAGIMPGLALTPDDFCVCVEAIHALVTDPEIEIMRTVEAGDWLSALVRVRCLSTSSGEPVEFSCQIMLRYRNGKIVEAYNNMDTTSLMIQLGALPPDVVEQFLTGQIAT